MGRTRTPRRPRAGESWSPRLRMQTCGSIKALFSGANRFHSGTWQCCVVQVSSVCSSNVTEAWGAAILFVRGKWMSNNSSNKATEKTKLSPVPIDAHVTWRDGINDDNWELDQRLNKWLTDPCCPDKSRLSISHQITTPTQTLQARCLYPSCSENDYVLLLLYATYTLS